MFVLIQIDYDIRDKSTGMGERRVAKFKSR